ncbi:MAG: Bax inhibitor-1 family protein [SAR324 cluster bacterium]|nr:Bax inhibitor-1 family protein [SAR324 cluster bacterium]
MEQSAQFNVAAQASVEERMAFLRKIYGLLSLSIMVAAAASWMALSTPELLLFTAENHFMLFIAEIGAIFFAMWARHKENLGLIALFLFTGLTGLTSAPMLSAYGHAVPQAASLTAIIFIGLSIYTVTSKRDFSFMGGMLTVGILLLVVGGLMNAFIFHSSATSFMFSSFGVFLFSGFIVYDTFNILNRYPTDEYISATLSLYLDILNLFMSLLHLLGGSRD